MMIPENNDDLFDFKGHLTSSFPSQLVVDVTENCNLACAHCPHASLKKKEQLTNGFLDKEIHHKLIDEIAGPGKGCCRYVRYTAQGETLLHPGLIDFIRYAKKKATSVQVNVTTNGTLMDESYSLRLLEAGVDVIDISLDAFLPETYSAIRRGGSLEITKSNVLTLLALRKIGAFRTRVVTSFVEQPENRMEAEDFKSFWQGQGCDFVVIRRLHTAAGAREQTSPDDLEDGDRYPCLYPWERLSLGVDGFLYYCPQDWVHGSRAADFRNSTVSRAWTGKFMEAVRSGHLKNDFSDVALCENCTDWRQTRWPHQGRCYSSMMAEFNKSF